MIFFHSLRHAQGDGLMLSYWTVMPDFSLNFNQNMDHTDPYLIILEFCDKTRLHFQDVRYCYGLMATATDWTFSRRINAAICHSLLPWKQTWCSVCFFLSNLNDCFSLWIQNVTFVSFWGSFFHPLSSAYQCLRLTKHSYNRVLLHKLESVNLTGSKRLD